MKYSVELLLTWADCDAALALAAERLRVLTKQGGDASYQLTNVTAETAELLAELKGLNARIAFLTPYLATLDAGDERTATQKELRRKTDRRDELESRKEAQGPVAQLTRELEQGETAVRVAEVNAFIADVQARRATLSA
ncbi:hypothetical protein E5K00_21365 [Hymenobacter aquaticus]|uniref:Uncharacterized protein n=1 Tax=Hymenobacter aquaticus TaxID=1867101 RepID=A0A4Z0PTB6_9BACT|nr:hypothetical protein [Hymenobacter aquaticus]TGE20546.1 hypothetical protein E5K00_21365 [Hymenobacter aquaticus]